MDSLSILCPSRGAATPDPPKSAPAALLEQLTNDIVVILNNRDWDNPCIRQYIAPNITAYMEHLEHPHATTREEWLAGFQKNGEDNPEYGFECISVNAEVDEKKGTAYVWFIMRIRGHPAGTVRESTTRNKWTRSRGKWVCVQQNGIRGVGTDVIAPDEGLQE